MKSLHDLKLARQRVDRNRRETDRVLIAMRNGAALHLQFVNGRPFWRLSTGGFVSADAANSIINRSDIASCGDALFYGMPGQTWRMRTKE